MNTRLFAPLALGALVSVTLFSSTTLAHHAFSAEFDANQPVEVKGVVEKTKWVNPHSWIYLTSTAADGSEVSWAFEFGTPSSLKLAGLQKSDLPPGTVVTVVGYKARNGQQVGYTLDLKLENGRTVRIGTPQNNDASVTPASYGTR